jgi:hypothetical protein
VGKLYNKLKEALVRWKDEYRITLMNDKTFEVKSVLKFKFITIFFGIFTFLVVFSVLIYLIISYSSIKHLIPGYGKYEDHQKVMEMSSKLDVLEEQLLLSNIFVENVQKIIKGEIDTLALNASNSIISKDSIDFYSISLEESLFRKSVEEKERFSIYSSEGESDFDKDVEYFIKPVDGILSGEYNSETGHYGIDIVAKEGTPIKAIYDGRVISANYSVETGYVIVLSHSNGLITIYKHNKELLKKVGKFVKVGELIAVLGSTGEYTSGPHLHFEMWFKGVSLNPTDFFNY